MKIKNFIKKNYKKLIIQFVSVVSAFVVFSVPCFAETNQQIIEGTGLWIEDYSLRANVSESSFGELYYTLKFHNTKYYSGSSLADSVHTGQMAWVDGFKNETADNQGYVPLQNRALMVTVLLPNSIVIKKNMSYSVEIPLVYLFGEESSNYNLTSDLIRVSLWDDSQSSQPYFDFYSTQKITWSKSNNFAWESVQNKVLINLSNYSEKDYVINYIRLAVRISNLTNFYETSAFGIYDDIVVTNNGKVYPVADTSKINELNKIEQNVFTSTETGRHNILNLFNTFQLNGPIGSGMLAVTKILNEFFGISAFSYLTDVSLTVGLCAFLLGIFATWGAISKSNRNKGNKRE